MPVTSSPPFAVSPATVLKPIALAFPETSGHEETAVSQSAFRERIDNRIDIAAYKGENLKPCIDQSGFKNMGDGTADQHFGACARNLSGPSEWVPVSQGPGLSPQFGTIYHLDNTQPVRYVKNGRHISLPICYRYDHDDKICNIHTSTGTGALNPILTVYNGISGTGFIDNNNALCNNY
jgi:hypothetical protein